MAETWNNKLRVAQHSRTTVNEGEPSIERIVKQVFNRLTFFFLLSCNGQSFFFNPVLH